MGNCGATGDISEVSPTTPLPLVNAKERLREGLAIAKMVTFASTAESAINLSIDDDTSTFVDCLEALETLESYGFEAEALKCRLNKIVRLNEIQRKVDEEKNEQKGKVSELKHEIVEVKEEIHKSDE
ncbi:hypothetical protein MLD38_029070 [Melastoma candidum]|uniref:Uncharacterized protein n=1 Tax=Melastoma candidum TaxID=119954 RepID=A0ACB9N2M0_9MYRT|nr:hypothetical protein MLD38_029070 [Melastoma candidum]